MADEYGASVLQKPAADAVTYDGRPVTPKRMVEIWTTNAEAMKPWHDEVIRAEGIRRGTLARKIAESWRVKHPEAAEAAPVRIPQRRTLESDLKARLGQVEPHYVRNAIGDLETDVTNAQAYEDYLNEWATSEYGVPFSTFLDLGVEVGGYLRVRLPSMADMDGRPDFFERLTERAYAKLSDDEKAAYKKDDDKGKRKRKPYVKVDAGGKEVPASKYAKLLEETDEDKKLSPMKRADRSKVRATKAKEAHDKAVERYLLGRPASSAQVFGGLDVVPIFKRGIGREQAVLAAAMTRQLVTVEEAISANYGWKGMGGRLLVPKGDSDSNTVGRNGCYYLYQMFLTQTDDEGIERPLLLYTLGGKGTSVDGIDPERDDAVGMIDLYDEFGIEGPLWSWHTGLKTRDRNPAYRQRPYLSDLIDLILAIEGQEMAIRATTQIVSFSGHVEKIGDALKGPNTEAVLDAVTESIVENGKSGKRLKTSKQPAPGETVTTIGDIEPWHQTQIGRDAWQGLASDRQVLAEAIAVDQAATAPGASGRAIVVGETLAKVAKKDVRDEALEAFRRDGEDHATIVAAIEKTFGICWPVQKVEEPPAEDASERARYSVAAWNPDWIGDEGQFTRLKAEYPEEYNLAALDEEAALSERGFSHPGNVFKKKGITDPIKEWQNILEWRMRQSPEYQMAVTAGVANRRGDKTMIEIIKGLQAQQKISEAGVPGARNGVPTSAMRRAGAQAGDQRGGPTAVQASKGGQIAADMQTASLEQEGQAQMAMQGAA